MNNIPAIALSAYFLILPPVDANVSTQSVPRRYYLQPTSPERANNPFTGEICVVLIDEDATIKANIETGTDAKLVADFNERAARWEKETAIYSAPGPALLHKDYIAIIAKGVANKKLFVPLILKRLQTSGSDWFFALENIAEENPAKNAENFADALNAWCGWAKSQGLIKETNEVLAA
jgi:hypothetical protein